MHAVIEGASRFLLYKNKKNCCDLLIFCTYRAFTIYLITDL